jgi:DNA-binding GntR family transcriptional regulator
MPRFSTVQEAITKELRDAIVTGVFPPGSRLVIEELAERFEVSPMPVREALRQLAAEGLVVIQSYRGATVSHLSVEEMREIFYIRQLLEGEAARLGALRLEAEGRERLRDLMDGMRDSISDPQRWLLLDRDFHMLIYESAGFGRLVRLIGQLRQDIERYIRLYITVASNIPQSMRRHQEILDACLVGDGERAREATVIHLQETAELFVGEMERGLAKPIRDRGGGDPP